MSVSVGVFRAHDKNALPMKRMIGIAKRRPAPLMMGNMLSFRSVGLRLYSLISHATPIASLSPIVA